MSEKRKPRPLRTILLLLLGGTTLACTPTPAVIEESDVLPPPQSTITLQIQTRAPEPGTSRANPYPAGQSATLPGDITLTIDAALRPADEQIKDYVSFNVEPDPGNEYVLLTISAVCTKAADSTCSLSTFSLKLVGSSGVEYDKTRFSLDNDLESGIFLDGKTRAGRIAYEIGIDETDLVLFYDPLSENSVYMALP